MQRSDLKTLHRFPPEGAMFRETSGDLLGDSSAKDASGREKTRRFRGGGRARKMREKVAEIEFFEVGNHAGNGHLPAVEVTKFSDNTRPNASYTFSIIFHSLEFV